MKSYQYERLSNWTIILTNGSDNLKNVLFVFYVKIESVCWDAFTQATITPGANLTFKFQIRVTT